MSANHSKGLSLIEVVVAIAILSFLMIALSNSWSGNFLRIRKSRFNNNVALFLEQKMIEVEARYRGKPIENIPKTEEGNFGEEFKSYKWVMESRDFIMPDITSLLVGQEQGASETLLEIVRRTADFISTSVKEVKVTVYVRINKKKEVSYSLTTYFVDYNKEFKLGLSGGG